ncbi:capsid protein [Plantago asiatica mosaic virus]|uniref:Coat protein n=1 Tax=Plantago asiatica mosaic potexvirus TaxID=28354 RepID=CAPSD_P1AMV|nr:capsid protein [Plantago asiatica mosaic virus]Q07506.1 RecName: Full=Coat protein; AltName: Full=Capsid protein; Short=CP [Plantago asiatica mosaic virus]BDH72994.1 coat protein [Plantago asiatica mosaic virus]CAA79765.1 capsid protein [Plantago asiatica mosaic virus]
MALNTAPTADALAAMAFPVSSPSVPTAQELDTITSGLTTLGVPTDSLLSHALALVNACFDAGSSSFVTLSGPSPTPTISLAQIAGVVKVTTTLRKFCRFYAKIIWNARLARNLPPAGFARANIKFEHRWAGFDFFDGLLNPAALEPPGGLSRTPTPDEVTANETARSLNLFEARASYSNLASTSTQFTRGQLSNTAPQVQFLPAPSD